jgi:hypothetical protein
MSAESRVILRFDLQFDLQFGACIGLPTQGNALPIHNRSYYAFDQRKRVCYRICGKYTRALFEFLSAATVKGRPSTLAFSCVRIDGP